MNSRDKMLIRAGRWAGQMDAEDNIAPTLVLDPIDDVEEFIVDAVADYIMSGSTDDFDKYIIEALRDEFGVISSEEAKKKERFVTYVKRPASDLFTCDICGHESEYPNHENCSNCIVREMREAKDRLDKETDT